MSDRIRLWEVHGSKENVECSVEQVAEDLFELKVEREGEAVVDEEFEDVHQLLENAERLHARTEHDVEEDMKHPESPNKS